MAMQQGESVLHCQRHGRVQYLGPFVWQAHWAQAPKEDLERLVPLRSCRVGEQGSRGTSRAASGSSSKGLYRGFD